MANTVTLDSMFRELNSFIPCSKYFEDATQSKITTSNSKELKRLVQDWSNGQFDECPEYAVQGLVHILEISKKSFKKSCQIDPVVVSLRSKQSKHMKHYESTLATITQEVYSAKTAQEAKTIMINYLETTNVKDKKKMIWDVSQLNNLTRVLTYFTNSLLRFEGLSVNTYTKD